MAKTKPGDADVTSFPIQGAGRESARRAARQLVKQRTRDGESVLERAQELSRRREAPARLLACELVPFCFDEDPGEAMAVLRDLVDDADHAVRAAAVAASSRIAEAHFERMASALAAWRDEGSPGARRAVAAVVARAAASHRLERAPHLLRLIGPLLADGDPTVYRAVGGRALDGLLRAYPEPAFEALVEWSMSSDPHVLRAIASALCGEAAAPLAKRALIVLRKLSLDERRDVWRVAASAMWRLGRRRPDIVRPELERWLTDETRGKVAREALRFL
jgi:hypothetical protein